jgi:protein-disulfide isomerase
MSTSLRKDLKDRRRKERQKQRQTAVLAIIAGAAILLAIIILPSLLKSSQPVGDFTVITPVARPQVNGTAMGDPNAPVRIDVFEDFQCPACQYYSQNVEKSIVENFVAKGTVYYVFRNYPFIDDRAATKESDQAANASLCAADQNRFWDYHDMLYANWKGENIGYLTDARLTAFAEAIGLDVKKFESCFDKNLFKDQIEQDLQDGDKMGSAGTPSVFVNGTLISPGQVPTYDDIAAAVQSVLDQ